MQVRNVIGIALITRTRPTPDEAHPLNTIGRMDASVMMKAFPPLCLLAA